MTRPPLNLISLEAFPARITRRVPFDSDAIEVQPAATVLPVFSATIQGALNALPPPKLSGDLMPLEAFRARVLGQLPFDPHAIQFRPAAVLPAFSATIQPALDAVPPPKLSGDLMALEAFRARVIGQLPFDPNGIEFRPAAVLPAFSATIQPALDAVPPPKLCGDLMPIEAFPARITGQFPFDSDAIEVRPASALLPVFSAGIQGGLPPPKFSGELMPIEAFPTRITGRRPFNTDAMAIQPAAAVLPVVSATIQSDLDSVRENPPLPKLHELISPPIAPPPLSAVIPVPTHLLALKRGAADEEKKRPATQFPGFAAIPIEALPAPSAPIFLSMPLPMGRAPRTTVNFKGTLRRIPPAAAKQVAAW